MITFINKANASKYRELFDKANLELNLTTEEDKISSLEEYFAVIRTLVASSGDRRYTMLPLDEEVFEIDANKRLITVPPSFKTNGISVQGDQVAEIVYFKIDRFFDATDLNETEIFIQWQAANGDKGISKEWVRDIESENGKLIFGWPLSEEITARSGDIKFAVRFVKLDKEDPNKILYSLSTLTADAKVRRALDFDLNKGVVDRFDRSDLILSRLVDSTAPIIGAGTSDLPFVTDMLGRIKDLDKETGEAILHVQAKSTDAGNITYEWNYYRLSFDENSRTYVLADHPEVVSDGEIVYIPTTSRVPNADIDYFVKYKENGAFVYRLADDTNWEAFEDAGYPEDAATTIYEKFCEFRATDIGNYTVKISNKRGKAPASFIPEENETFEECDLICTVPAPAAPVVTDIYKDKVEGTPIYSYIIAEPEVEVPTLSDGTKPAESVVLAGHATISDEGFSTLTYQWEKSGVNIDEATETTLTVSGANAEGNYVLKANNNRNGYDWEIKSTHCRVSYPPINPQLLVPDINHIVNQPISASSFIVSGTGRVDAISGFAYQWYKENQDGVPVAISGATSETYSPDKGGIYEVEVFSIYNGMTLASGTMSDEIKVVTPDA